MSSFYIKPKIEFGEYSLNVIKEHRIKKCFIVTDKSIMELKLINKVLNVLDSEVKVEIFSKVTPNPTIDIIEEGMKQMITFDPDYVIAIGGGSPIDACKGMLYFEKKIAEEINEPHPKRYFIAIPTTSGTGSEVTSYSVISSGKRKIALANDEMLPNLAILNPSFMETLPPHIIADTGMDVLTHALESFVSSKRNAFTNPLALEALKLINENLIEHYKNPKEVKYRENVQNASCMAGIAFNNSSLGINHSIAHIIGAIFKLSHGRANAIIMPYIIDENTNADEYYSLIAQEFKLNKCSELNGKKALIEYIKEMKKIMGIPVSLEEVGIKLEDYKKEIPTMILEIKKDICTSGNPNKFDDKKLIEILLRIFFGN